MEELKKLQPTRDSLSPSLGQCVWKKVKNTYGDTLPLPGDFKPLPAEKLRPLRLVTDQPQPSDPTEQAVHEYLQSIGISLSTAVALGLGYQQQEFNLPAADTAGKTAADSHSPKRYLPALAYRFTVEGRTVNVKYRSCARIPSLKTDAPAAYTKEWKQVSAHSELGISPCFIDTISPERLQGQRLPRVILTEGEKDCLALYEAGYRHFFSVPTGASSDPAKYLAPFIHWLDAVDSIVLCGDTDYPGRQMMHQLSEFFGIHACLVDLPADCKDIADVLVKHGPEEVQRVIEGAHPQPTDAIRTVDTQTDRIADILHGHYDHGYDLGYGPFTDRVFHPDNGGGLMVISGQPNSGKSDFLNDVAVHLMLYRDKHVLFLPFESPDLNSHTAQLIRLMRHTNDLSLMPREEVEKDVLFLHQHMAYIDLKNQARTPEHIIQLADGFCNHHPLHYLIIDPYLFIEFNTQRKYESETESIKHMLTAFQSWGQERHVWVCIVAHPRKSQTPRSGFTSDDVSPDDIASSAHWKNLADFLFVIKRVNEKNRRYTELRMIKVRNQTLCCPGSAYYVRTPCGNYLEQDSPESCLAWYEEHSPQGT